MKVSIHIIYILVLSSISVIAQTEEGSIIGNVSAQNNPAEFMKIILEGTSLGATTDAGGNFKIVNVPYGKYKMQFSGIGYTTYKTTVTVNNSKPVQLNVSMLEDVNQLNEVMVVSGT